MTLLLVSSIRLNGGTQSRAELNDGVIDEYAEAMRNGTVLPDVIVFFDGSDHWLGDGFHRVHGASRAGLKYINADVRQGTRRDAVLYSVGANHAHGLRRTNEDKRRAITTLLLDQEWVRWSDREIARRCGVDHVTVGRLRKELELSGEIHQIDERQVTRGGATYAQDTERIGDHENPAGAPPTGEIPQSSLHWSVAQGDAFWRKVRELGLDTSTIVRRIQASAATLKDMTVSREKAFETLHRLALDDLRQRFPVGSLALHIMTRRVGQVKDHTATSLKVYDLKLERDEQWMASGLRSATKQDRQAYLKAEGKHEAKQALQMGDTVRTRTGRVTTVTSINGRQISVEGDTRHHYLETLTKITPAEMATADEEETAEHVLPPGDSTPPKPKPSATEGKPGTGAALREALIGKGFDTVFKVAQHKDGAYTAAFDSSIRHTNESAAGSARDYAEQLALAGYHVERAGADIDVTLGFNGYPTPMVRFRTVDETDDGDEWYTPPDILALARELMGGIDVDPASSDYAQRAVQAAAYYTRFTNGLRHPWRGRVWLNPPYSYPLVERFTQKLVEEYERGSVTQAVVLVNNRTDANWCQQLMLAATATCFSAERIGFEHPRLGKPDQNRQGQIFFYFGEQPLPFARLFGHFGAIYGAAVAAALLSTAEHEARAAKASGEAAR